MTTQDVPHVQSPPLRAISTAPSTGTANRVRPSQLGRPS